MAPEAPAKPAQAARSDSRPLGALTESRSGGYVQRLRLALAGLGAAILGAAPHVLHHVGPLAGATLLAGAAGTALFGALGLVAAVPLLARLHRRSGSWRLPTIAASLMSVAFALSTFVIGPAISGDNGDDDNAPAAPSRQAPGHSEHHR